MDHEDETRASVIIQGGGGIRKATKSQMSVGASLAPDDGSTVPPILSLT